MERTILHCDCNGFFASVECALNPELKNVPMAVCGSPENRHGIILAKNELAKACNVQTAETIWQAKKKCKDLVLVPPHHGEYAKYSRAINKIYEKYTDKVEPFGIDESWLDVTDTVHLFGSGEKIANELRKIVKEKFDITISVGVSYNKIFAKLGSDYKKPDATTVINKENYKKLLFPLKVTNLLYVGKSSNKVLQSMGIKTIGDLANADRKYLEKKLGKNGIAIYDYANGLDFSPVASIYNKEDQKSISNAITFKRDLIGIEDIKFAVMIISDSVVRRMRKLNVKAYTIQIMIKDDDFKVISRQITLNNPTHLLKDIVKYSIDLIKNAWNLRIPIRMLSVGVANLVKEGQVIEQISLFDKIDEVNTEKQEKIEEAMFKLRDKFGRGSVGIAATIKNDLIDENYTTQK